MKQIIFFLAIALLVFPGCPPSSAGSGAAKTDGETTDKNEAKTYKVAGQLMSTRDYCGGARPPEDLLKEYRTPKPFPGMTIYARSGEANTGPVKAEFSTDTDGEGRFSFDLPAGTWCILIAEKAARELYGGGPNIEVDQECYQEWMATCDQVITVKEGPVEAVNLQLHRRCRVETWSKCARFTGPPPPSPPPSGDR